MIRKQKDTIHTDRQDSLIGENKPQNNIKENKDELL